MAKDSTKVVKLGPCSVTVDAVNIGYTGPNGATVNISDEVTFSQVADFGNTNFRGFLTGCMVELEIELAQTELDKMAALASSTTTITDGASYAVGIGKKVGAALSGVQVIVTPVDTNQPTFTIYKAVANSEYSLPYTGADGATYYTVKFEALADDSKTTDCLARFGSTSISADTTAPTFTVVPLDEATDVVVTSNVIWTFSEELDPATVNTSSVYCVERDDPSENIAGSVTLVNNVASTTITFNPTSDLSASTGYTVFLTQAITDKAGNALAELGGSEFTTAA